MKPTIRKAEPEDEGGGKGREGERSSKYHLSSQIYRGWIRLSLDLTIKATIKFLPGSANSTGFLFSLQL